jgi:hypothetical protein
MAMTEHRSVGTVMGYFQAGSLLASRASALVLPGGVTQTAPLTVPPVANQTDQ